MRVLRLDGSVFNVDEEDIIYFTTHNKQIYVHTRHDEFILPTTFEQLAAAYKELSFERLDRSFLANLNELEGYHAERKSVYFDEPLTPASKFVPVSENNVKKVHQYLQAKNEKTKG